MGLLKIFNIFILLITNKINKMTRFETLDRKSLGTRQYSGKELGSTWFSTKEELELLWNLSEDTKVISDNNWSGTVGDLKDLFFSLRKLTDKQVDERFGKGRSKSGLGLQYNVSNDGKLFLTR